MRAHTKRPSCLALSLALVVTAVPLPAQEWSLSAQMGKIRSALDPAAIPEQSFAVGLRYDDPTAGLRLSAGVPTSATQALWGGIGAWKRLAISHRGVVAGLDVAANGFITAERTAPSTGPIFDPFDPPSAPTAARSGHAIAVQALPVIGFNAERIQVHARAGVSRYTVSFGDQLGERTVRLADVQATLSLARQMALVPVVRRFEASGAPASTYAGVSSVVASGAASLWASVGRWTGGNGGGTPWSAGTKLRLHDLLSLEASARRETYDPLYLQPAQTSWSIGLSVLLGRRPAALAPPVPAAYVNGRATVRLPVSESRTLPSIAGDFNAWKPAPMSRVGDHWEYAVTLAPGVYHYAFVSAGGEWFVPESVPGRRSDGMGGHVAVLVVR